MCLRTHQEEQTSRVIKKLFSDIWEDVAFLFFAGDQKGFFPLLR